MPTNARAAGIVAFGDALLRTGDLDPVYTAIYNARLDERTLLRLALAYWCFYHLGVAARLAETKTDADYWRLFQAAVDNVEGPTGKRPWPRGTERRHFRGKVAQETLRHLLERYKTPAQAVRGMLAGGSVSGGFAPPRTFQLVSRAVQSHVGFGPWMAFKIADMAERVLGSSVDFSNCELGIYKDPRQGAAVAHLERYVDRNYLVAFKEKPWTYPITDADLRDSVEHYTKVFRDFKAPPTGNRRVNVQEVETIFCKYKSHLKGHYPVGKDTEEIGHGLVGWGDLAEQLNQGLHETRDRVWAWRKKHGA